MLDRSALSSDKVFSESFLHLQKLFSKKEEKKNRDLKLMPRETLSSFPKFFFKEEKKSRRN